MTDHEFRRLVAAHEHTCRIEPERFAVRTVLMAAFGYAAIVTALVVCALVLLWVGARLLDGQVSYVWVMVAIGCASLLWSLSRALWSRQRPPEGLRIRRADAPELFKLIEKVRKRCGAPRPDVVLIDGELNAAIVQQPRLGLLGWHRNYLILGLPLLMGLDVKQVAAVIGHEFGHLRGAHGKLGAWVYRTRLSWWKLAEARARSRVEASVADAGLALFFRHFFPRFNARAFVLSRQQEYEADRTAHKVVGTRPGASGLISLALQSRWLDEVFWPGIFRAAGEVAMPTGTPYRVLQEALPRAVARPEAGQWLREALKRLPEPSDTHPSLRDRLEFAQVAPSLPKPIAESAAATLLPRTLDRWIERMDLRWQKEAAPAWAERHRRHQAQRALVDELAQERAQKPLNVWDHLAWAHAAREVEGDAAACEVLRALLVDHPQQPEARFELGMLLIESPSAGAAAEGAERLRTLADECAHHLAVPAAERYEQWVERGDDRGPLKAWRERLAKIALQHETASQALEDFDGAQHFTASDLGPRGLRPVLDVLRREPAVGRAFLVEKTVQAAAGWRFGLVVVERARGHGGSKASHLWSELRERIDLPFPFMVIDLAHDFWKDDARRQVVRQITETPGACIYSGRRL